MVFPASILDVIMGWNYWPIKPGDTVRNEQWLELFQSFQERGLAKPAPSGQHPTWTNAMPLGQKTVVDMYNMTLRSAISSAQYFADVKYVDKDNCEFIYYSNSAQVASGPNVNWVDVSSTTKQFTSETSNVGNMFLLGDNVFIGTSYPWKARGKVVDVELISPYRVTIELEQEFSQSLQGTNLPVYSGHWIKYEYLSGYYLNSVLITPPPLEVHTYNIIYLMTEGMDLQHTGGAYIKTLKQGELMRSSDANLIYEILRKYWFRVGIPTGTYNTTSYRWKYKYSNTETIPSIASIVDSMQWTNDYSMTPQVGFSYGRNMSAGPGAVFLQDIAPSSKTDKGISVSINEIYMDSRSQFVIKKYGYYDGYNYNYFPIVSDITIEFRGNHSPFVFGDFYSGEVLAIIKNRGDLLMHREIFKIPLFEYYGTFASGDESVINSGIVGTTLGQTGYTGTSMLNATVSSTFVGASLNLDKM